MQPNSAEPSEDIAQRVARARSIQQQRYQSLKSVSGENPPLVNAHVSNTVIEKTAAPDDAGRKLLEEAASALKFSARGFHRVLKVARTLADLEGVDQVGRVHLAEAISYRMAGERLVTA